MVNLQKAADLSNALQSAGGDYTTEERPWVSRTKVIETPTIDSAQYEGAYAAKSALSLHVSLATEAVKGQPTMQIRQEFEPFVSQLKNIKLPDTRLSLGNQKFEYPWDISDYANKIQQNIAVNLLTEMLGEENAYDLYKMARLAGQEEKPTLWLAQKIYLETKHSYVHTIRHNPELTQAASDLQPDMVKMGNEAIKELFGPRLIEELEIIARGNDLSIYAVFVILYHQVIDKEKALRQPSMSSTIWGHLPKKMEEAKA